MSEPAPAAKFKVLVVDDEVIMTKTAKYILGKKHDVTCANNLAEGLEAIEHVEFDAAMVDDRMPDGRGPELLLRLADRWPRCLRYLVTANLGIVDELDAVFFKVVTFVSKPVDLHAFLPALETSLAKKPPRGDA